MASAVYIKILRKYGLAMLFFVVACFALSGSLVFYFETKKDYEESLTRASNERQNNSYAQAQMDVYEQYYPEFSRLKVRGFVGGDHRLDWLESLQYVSKYYQIPTLNYTLEHSLEAVDGVDFYSHPSLDLLTTEMKLNFKLMHEGDWYHLLRYLHTSAKGIFSVESCLTQLDSATLKGSLLHGLYGECKLLWYSLLDSTQVSGGRG